MVSENDVAVVGMSCVFAGAPTLKQYWSNLVNGVDAVGEAPAGRWPGCTNFDRPADHEAFLSCKRGGYLTFDVALDPVAYGVPPNLIRHGDPDQFFALHLIDGALRDAHIADDSPLRRRTDVLVGQGGYPTDKHIEWALRSEHIESVLELLGRRCPELTGRREELETYLRSALTDPAVDNVSTGVSNLTASRAANRLNLRGAAFVVDAACASSLIAVEQAMGRLRAGRCDVAVVAGLFVALSLRVLHVFTRLGALSPSGVIRPFDRRADGLVPGEGGGAVVLKRLADAVRDGDEIYAILKGAGSSSDGRGVDVLAPSSAGQVAALEAAYADAGIDRATVGYLELHGTGTAAGDAAEIATIKTFFGTVAEPATARAMGSVKSMIGHTLPAAGMASLIKAALMLSNKILPPSLHAEEARSELADAPFYLNTQTRPWIHNPALGPRRAAVNAFGFGGINAHVILEEVPPTRKPRPIEPGVRRASELAVFAAASEDELRAKVERLERFLDGGAGVPPAGASGRRDACPTCRATLVDVAATLAREFDVTQPVKLALVSEDIAHLRRLMHSWREQRSADSGATQEIYYATDAAGHDGKIAFVFPGMGFPGMIGGYPDRLMELCLHYPEVRAEFDHFEDRDRHPEDTVPTSAIFSPPACLPEEYRRSLKSRLYPPKADDYGEPLPRERYLAAMGVTLSNWVSWLLLRKFDIPVDMLAGQSQGEMAALCAAGAADFHQLAPAFWKVLNVDARDANGGQIAFAWTAAETVEALVAQTPGTYVAIYMAPEGVIFGGDRDGVRRIADQLRERQVYVQTLPYPPIHTPALTSARIELRQLLEEEQALIRKPAIDLYSSITTAKYPADEKQIFDTLLMNVDCPLRIWQTALRMYDDGARFFVQVGGGHMAAHRMMLPEGYRVTAAALDVDGRNPLTQLNHLLATLLCGGVSLRLDALFAHRPVRQLDLDLPQSAPMPSGTLVPLRMSWSPLASGRHEPAGAETITGRLTPAARLAPLLGTITHRIEGQELTIERTLDLAEDLFLRDHTFVYAPHKPVPQQLPVLPLTMSMEFAAEAAALLMPGLGLIGFEKIRGRRWIALNGTPTTALRIEAQLLSCDAETGVRRVQVTLFSEDAAAFSAVVLLGEAYRQDLDVEVADCGEAAWPLGVEQVYPERYMFHGPAFQCLAELHAFGERGASATLAARPRGGLFASHPEPMLLTDPCLFDGVGQVVGLWARLHRHYILPLGVDKIEFYGPPPAPGSVSLVRVEILAVDRESQQIRANVELTDGDGNVWARVAGWTEYVWNCSDAYIDCTELPHLHTWAHELDLPSPPAGSVCALMPRDELRGINLDWTARLYLHEDELPAYFALTDKERRRQFLASRIAVKDAARRWWARRHASHDLPHPSLFAIAHDDMGRPYLLCNDGAELPHISLAHTTGGAAAIAADVPVGIDIEPVERDVRGILPDFATVAEREVIEALAAVDSTAALRLWCAKEAMAKALGTGLQGRPKSFEALAVEDGGDFLMHHHPTGERLAVHTAAAGDFLVAVCGLASPGGLTESIQGDCEREWTHSPR